MPTLTPAHDVVPAVLDWFPMETVADAALVAALLAMPEADAAWLLDGLEAAGNFWALRAGSAPIPPTRPVTRLARARLRHRS